MPVDQSAFQEQLHVRPLGLRRGDEGNPTDGTEKAANQWCNFHDMIL
jgi:hypothetical protein